MQLDASQNIWTNSGFPKPDGIVSENVYHDKSYTFSDTIEFHPKKSSCYTEYTPMFFYDKTHVL